MKKIILIISIIINMFIFSNVIYADDYTLYVGDEDLYINTLGVKTNTLNTAWYDSATNTLTLNNYNGGVIYSSINDTLKINLVGTNKIDGNDEDNEGIYTRKSLEISGTGTLTITGVYDGIYAENGSTYINSNIKIDADSEGIYARNNIKINDGNINIKSNYAGLTCDGLTINKGKIIIESDLIGIGSNEYITINGGYTSIKTSNDGIAIFAVSESNPRFTIANNLEVLPKELSLQTATFEVDEDVYYKGITIGTKGVSIDLSEGINLKNVATEVIITEVVPNTYDNINNIIIICLSSLLGLILLLNKKILRKVI